MIRKPTVSIVIALAALLAAACSGGGDDGAGEELVALDRAGFASDVSYVETVASRTAELQSYQFEIEFGMDGIPDLGSLTIDGEGAVDAKQNRTRLAFDLSSALESMSGGASEMELAMLGGLLGDGQVEFLLDGDTMYLKWSLFAALFGADTEWVSFEGGEGSDFLDLGGVDVGSMGTGPGAFFEFFNGIATMEEAGRFIIRGVETTKFVGSIDLEEAIAAAADASERAELEAQFASLGVDAFGAMPVALWVDDLGYVRRFEMTMDFDELSGGMGGSGTMFVGVELFNFGDSVSIDLPDSGDVTVIDENSLFGGLSFEEGEGY